MKEREVEAIQEIENQIKEREIHQQESLVTEGTTLEANLSTDSTPLDTSSVTEGISLDDNLVAKENTYDSVRLSKQLDESCSLKNECSRSGNENKISDNESSSSGNDVDANIGPSYDSDTVLEVHHDIFENMFVHGIQNHEQPESIPNTYVVNENNRSIISDIPNMDPNRDKEEHDYVDHEQQHAFFASLINNLKCDATKCNKVNHEAQQANALLTNELERYKEKEKHFAKDKTIQSEYCKKIKLLNDKILSLKSQACQNDKTFTKENGKYDEYVQPLLNRKNELKKNQKFLKQINDLDKKLRKAGQTNQTLCMLLPKEDNVNTGKQDLAFENKNDVENPSLLNKAKELVPSLYNVDEMGKDLLSDHKIISEEELKCKAEKRLKVKQRKSPLSCHGFLYGETQFVEPPKVPLKRRDKSLYDSDPSSVESESGEKKILFGNETSSFETKIKELRMTLAQQTKDFENAKVVLERPLDRNIQDSKAEKDQFLKEIALLESKLASQDIISNKKEYNELRISYNALKEKFYVLN
uniref:Reverse transcriptase zinc-binding domain-containing protein n=1 Tax=Tanacetum cinerariifolium TaxID=118510 RepID=A0A699HE03_TANCI|nr:reverse transcriptase zinc-binding domain-containing protein [Tanacetum cinerariifolium]